MKISTVIPKDLQAVSLLVGSAVLFIWLLSVAGIFTALNSYFYESSTSIFAEEKNSRVVTLISEKNSLSGGQDLKLLITKLNEFFPAKILLITDNSEILSDNNIKADKVELVFIPQRSISNDGRIRLISDPAFSSKANSGFVIPPPLGNGMVRSATLTYNNGSGEILQSFLHNFAKTKLSQQQYVINFDKVSSYIPIITENQVMQNKVVEQLIKDKIVILEDGNNLQQTIIVTPLTENELGMSLLQFHALSLDAVLSNAVLIQASAFEILLVILLSLVLLLFSMQKLKFHGNLLVLVLIILLGIFIMIVSSHLMGRILPLTEFILSSIASYWVYFHFLQRQMVQQNQQLSSIINTELSSIVQQQNFNEVEQPWLEIVSFVQLYLQLNKTIFLEKVPGDHRVKEIQALNCSLDDILEQRRDYERTPYSTALKENAAVEISRPYFKETEKHEDEFIVPLTFAGEVLGFWAMSYQPHEGWNKNKFLLNVHSFAEQIAHLLYNRNNFQQQSVLNNNQWQRLSKGLFPQMSDSTLKYDVHRSLSRLSLYQNMFNAMHSAAIIYDLFGRVIEVNHSMENIFNRNNMNVFELNALDLLRNITGKEEDNIRSRLRHVILSQQSIHYTTTSVLDEHTYLVSVTAVIAEKSKPVDVVEAGNPFSVIGLLVEFINIGSMKELMNVEHNLFEQYLNNIKNALSTMHLLQIQLNLSLKNKPVKVKKLTDDLEQQLTLIDENTKITHQLITNLANDKTSVLVPVDVYASYLSSTRRCRQALADKNINIDVQFPDIPTLAIVNAEELLSILKLIFDVLIEDAQLDSNIIVIGKHKLVKGKILFYLSIENTGFGLPKEHIDEIGNADTLNEKACDMAQLKQLFDGMHRWNASGRVRSKLGNGIRFSLILTGVSLGA